MCIIIHSPSGAIDEDHLRRSLFVNSDGWGFAIAQGTALYVRKGLTPATFWEQWEQSQRSMAGLPVLFHARIRTQGKIVLDNCHPFPVGDGWVMAHNGCIWGFGDKKQSDTAQLAGIIRAVGPNAFMTEEGQTLLKNVIGNNDKLVFMHASGLSVKVNGGFGHIAGGNWYSNYSYKNYQQQVPIVWKASATTIGPKPATGPALGAPSKKTKPRFQEDDISSLRPELRKLRADIIVRSAMRRQEKRSSKKISGLAAPKKADDGKLVCDRGEAFFDSNDMLWQEPSSKYADGYSKIDWDAMGEEDWKRETAKIRRDDGENTPIPKIG